MDRVEHIMQIQANISRELNQELIGKTVPVLVEGFNPETELLLNGRTATMAPDVDGHVLIDSGTAETGDIVPVNITEAHTYDIVGSIERKN